MRYVDAPYVCFGWSRVPGLIVNDKWPGWRPPPPPASLAPAIPGAPAPLPPVAALPPVQPLPLPPSTLAREMPKRRTWPIRFEHGERQRGS